jgi:hypothetical protein
LAGASRGQGGTPRILRAARGKRRGMRSLSKRRPSDTNHPAFARYEKMLMGLEALERKAQEVRYRVQARRRLIS